MSNLIAPTYIECYGNDVMKHIDDKDKHLVFGYFRIYGMETNNLNVPSSIIHYCACYYLIITLKQDFVDKLKSNHIAEQMTLITFDKFKRIKYTEFMNKAWRKENKLELAPNLCQLVDYFQDTLYWIQIIILNSENVEARSRTIRKFIKIMVKLIELNNFQSLCAVYGAISSTAIYSLNSAWSYVPKKYIEKWRKITYHFKVANSMHNMRLLHKKRNPPMIPYSGIYLYDILNAEQENIPKKIDDVLSYANIPYNHLTDNRFIQMCIQAETAHLGCDDVDKLSKKIEKADNRWKIFIDNTSKYISTQK